MKNTSRNILSIVSAILFLVLGIFYIVDDKILLGCLWAVVSVFNFIDISRAVKKEQAEEEEE